MLNKGEAGTVVFEPALANMAVGDTVTFTLADKVHNAEAIQDIFPVGAAPFKGKISAGIAITFNIPVPTASNALLFSAGHGGPHRHR